MAASRIHSSRLAATNECVARAPNIPSFLSSDLIRGSVTGIQRPASAGQKTLQLQSMQIMSGILPVGIHYLDKV
jgi:hypothetical protein